MEPTNLPNALLDALKAHLPPGSGWLPVAGLAVTAIVGVIFMVKGAKLAPVLAALVFAGLGAAAGNFTWHLAGTPPWPTVIVGSSLGLILGVVFFRFWFALLVAVCLISSALSLYGGKVLQPALLDYQSRGLQTTEADPGIQLPAAPPEALQALPVNEELAKLWTYLGEKVPNFHASFYSIVITTGLAGLIFALLLPKAARAFWAATVGVGLFVPAVYAGLREQWAPGAAFAVEWGPIIAAVLWSLSLAFNLADMHGWRPKKKAAPAAKPATA